MTLPALRNSKIQYHAGSDTYYVVGNYEDDDPMHVPEVLIKIERGGEYGGTEDTRKEIAQFVHSAIVRDFPAVMPEPKGIGVTDAEATGE